MLRQVVGVRRAGTTVQWRGREKSVCRKRRGTRTVRAAALEDGVLRRQAHDAIPGTALRPQLTSCFKRPRPRQGVSDWLHVCNLKGKGRLSIRESTV